jgi:uncharacterized membrane protein
MGMTGHVRKKFITGLFVLIPLLVTAYVILLVVSAFDSVVEPFVRRLSLGLLGREMYVPGAGMVLFVVIAYLTGVLTSNYVGKRVVGAGERALRRIPFVKGIYSSVKDMTEAFSSEKKRSFQEVVLTEFPFPGRYAVGFVVNRVRMEGKGLFCSVFVPTTPNPTSGYLILVPEEEVMPTGMTVDEALRYIVSIGTAKVEKGWIGTRSE